MLNADLAIILRVEDVARRQSRLRRSKNGNADGDEYALKNAKGKPKRRAKVQTPAEVATKS
jgi:hypothetical protein